MRTTSSFKFVGVLLGPLKMVPDVGAGKILGEHRGRHLRGGRNVDRSGTEITTVGGRIRNGLTGGDVPYDQPAPFHVVKEEGLLPVGIVELAKCNGAAYVKTKNVQAQLRDRGGTRIEESARIQCVVTVELPCGGMKGARPGLENHGHRRCRRKPVIRTVVRRKSAKLRDGVSRRGNAHAARATPVIIF